MIDERMAEELDAREAAEIIDDEGNALLVRGLVEPRRLASITGRTSGLHALTLGAELLDEAVLRPASLAPLLTLLFPEGVVLDAARLAVPPLHRKAHGPLFAERHVRPRLYALRVDIAVASGDATLSDLRAFAPELDGPHLALLYTQPWFTDVETAPNVPPLSLAAEPPASLRSLFR